MARERRQIEIDSGHVRAIMDRYGLRTEAAAVDLALRHLVGQPMSREDALAMRGVGAIGDTPVDAPPRAVT
jgi:Arc/MetJ family transcription regulator